MRESSSSERLAADDHLESAADDDVEMLETSTEASNASHRRSSDHDVQSAHATSSSQHRLMHPVLTATMSASTSRKDDHNDDVVLRDIDDEDEPTHSSPRSLHVPPSSASPHSRHVIEETARRKNSGREAHGLPSKVSTMDETVDDDGDDRDSSIGGGQLSLLGEDESGLGGRPSAASRSLISLSSTSSSKKRRASSGGGGSVSQLLQRFSAPPPERVARRKRTMGRLHRLHTSTNAPTAAHSAARRNVCVGAELEEFAKGPDCQIGESFVFVGVYFCEIDCVFLCLCVSFLFLFFFDWFVLFLILFLFPMFVVCFDFH